jgi:endonuclease-3 related protein
MHDGGPVLREIYDRLMDAYGPRDWWPGEGATEVVIGAILTQNTAWTNVERAIVNLRAAGGLDWVFLRDVTDERLCGIIRPAGTYRVKAARIRAFVETLWTEHGGSLQTMLSGELHVVRRRLLGVHGIGRETADAILLYAGGRLSFVVDAYTRRILRRHFVVPNSERVSYDFIQGLFHTAMDANAQDYNEYHALLVEVGKRHCRSSATCEGCPLAVMAHDATF